MPASGRQGTPGRPRPLPAAARPAITVRGAGRPATAGAAPAAIQGVVQSISAGTVVVKELDGTIVDVAVDRRTRVYVDGRPARAAAVAPGGVLVEVTWRPHGSVAAALWILTTG